MRTFHTLILHKGLSVKYVVNIYGGPGSGKSTTAAGVYAWMKSRNPQFHVELVREWVKLWAYERRNFGEWDQFYICSQQMAQETSMLQHVPMIVTDSPILMGAYYTTLHGCTYAEHLTKILLSYHNSHKSFDFMLRRNKVYVQHGRYQTEDQACKVDVDIRNFLQSLGVSYIEVDTISEICEHVCAACGDVCVS